MASDVVIRCNGGVLLVGETEYIQCSKIAVFSTGFVVYQPQFGGPPLFAYPKEVVPNEVEWSILDNEAAPPAPPACEHCNDDPSHLFPPVCPRCHRRAS